VTTEQREWTRRLAWEGCLNARDLGGYRTADGRETRWGAVVRSDSPAALTEAGRAALADYGVRAIVDLRLPTELADAPKLLGLVGVPAETVAADYAMTGEALRPQLEAWLDSDPDGRAEREALLARYAPTVEVMLEVLARLADRHGGVEPYLLEAGVPKADLDRLRVRLLPPGPRADQPGL
jgi:hypothetical protein